MRILFFLLILFATHATQAQQPLPGNLSVLQHKPISFNFNNVEELLGLQTINNAFEIQMYGQPYNMNVYAQVVFFNNANRNSFAGKLLLKLSHTSSSNAIVSNHEIVLSHTPVLLFRQPRNNSPVSQLLTFTYDIMLKPLEEFVKPDDHSFSLIITVTPE